MNKKTKTWGTTLICSILSVITVLLCSSWYTKQSTFTVQFKQEALSDISYKVCWATTKNENFSSARAVVKNVPASQKKVTIELPTNKIARFRIDPTAKKKGTLQISDLQIHSSGIAYIFNDLHDFRYIVDKGVRVSYGTNSVKFVCSRPASKMEYKQALNLQILNPDEISFPALITTAVVSFLLYFLLVRTIWNNIAEIINHKSGSTRTSASFITYLGGIRGFAILLVLLFHILPAYFSQGYLGVDIFFVISGYLLFLGHKEGVPFNPLTFIHKKVLRIVPLLSIAVFIALILVAPVIFSATTLEEIGSAAFTSLLAYSNFDYIIKYSDYFATNANLNALLHTWYLSALIQIYLLWAIGSFLLFHISRKVRILIVSLVSLISFVYCYSYEIQTYFEQWDLPTWGQISPVPYYHTFGRLWQLGAAGLIFLLPEIRNVTLKTSIALSCLLVILTTCLCNYSLVPISAMVVVASTVLLIWSAKGMKFASILENKPLLWVGKISFSLYLIHFPIIVFYKRYTRETPDWLCLFYLSAIAIVVAYVVWKYIEKRKFSIGTTCALFCLALVCSSAVWQHKKLHIEPFAYSAVQYPVYEASQMDKDIETELLRNFSPQLLFAGKGTQALLRGNYDFAWEDTKHIMPISNIKKHPEFLLIGDSTAQQMYAGFDTMCNKIGVPGIHLTTTVIPFWDRFLDLDAPWYKWNRDKSHAFFSWLRAHPKLHTVVIGQLWENRIHFKHFRNWDGKLQRFTPEENIQSLRKFCEQIKALGRNVVLVSPTPVYNGLDISGLEYMRWKERCGGGVEIEERILPLAITKKHYDSSFQKINSVFTQWEQEGFCKILHVERGIFQKGDYLMFNNNQLYCRDQNHITPAGAIYVMDVMHEEFFNYIKDGRLRMFHIKSEIKQALNSPT